MKNKLPFKRFISALVLLTITTLSWAYDFEVDGIYYDKNGSSVTVTSGTNNYSGDVVIPASVTYESTTYNVTKIGESAFEDCEDLTSVTLPESITTIDKYAFWGCEGLTSITIPKNVSTIGESAFHLCSNLIKVTIKSNSIVSKTYGYNDNIGTIFGSQVEEYIIDDGVTKIGKYAFYDCRTLTSVTIGSSVKSIGRSAFLGCSGLTSITIPNSVTTIGAYAFGECSGLTSVSIPNSVKSIGEWAFSGCSGLMSVTIPESVTSIGNDAFNKCSGLTKAEFASIESLCKISFGSFDSNPLYYAKHLYVDGKEVTNLIIPNSVTSIGRYAFYGCTGLTSVTIPKRVTSIEISVFAECTGLTSITIPNSVTSIGNDAFRYCSGLTSITIPNSVTSIGYGAFYKCTGLTKVEFASIESLCKISFVSSDSNPLYYAKHLYVDGKEVTNLVIPESVTSIGYNTFRRCTGLTSVIIPNSMTSIVYDAFDGCTGLTSVTIGRGVTSIDDGAFDGCTSLNNIICMAESVPTTGRDVFQNVPQSTATLYVPASSVDAYKVAEEWKNFGTILPMDDPSGVDELKASNASKGKNAPIYDLNGRKLTEKPRKEFYIQGGKKYVAQ